MVGEFRRSYIVRFIWVLIVEARIVKISYLILFIVGSNIYIYIYKYHILSNILSIRILLLSIHYRADIDINISK